MSYLKRLTVSLRAQVDYLVSQVEDHEAVVDAAILDAKKTLADSRVRIRRVRHDGERIQQQMNLQQQAHKKWENRAKQLATEDENTALECLRRSQDAANKAQQLTKALSDHQAQQAQLQSIIHHAEQRLQEKVQRRNLMSTRESTLKTNQNILNADSPHADNWNNAFDRWETHITEMEINQELNPDSDQLDYEFTNQENLNALRDDLQQLITEGKVND